MVGLHELCWWFVWVFTVFMLVFKLKWRENIVFYFMSGSVELDFVLWFIELLLSAPGLFVGPSQFDKDHCFYLPPVLSAFSFTADIDTPRCYLLMETHPFLICHWFCQCIVWLTAGSLSLFLLLWFFSAAFWIIVCWRIYLTFWF